MNKRKQIEEMEFTEVDILANDINQHCADLAETYCGGINCLSCLAHALTAKSYRKASEVALEVIKEVERILDVKIIGIEEDFFHGTAAHWDATRKDCYEEILVELAELKKKYTEERK